MLIMMRLLSIILLISLTFSLPFDEKYSNFRTAVTVREASVVQTGHRSSRSPGMPEKKKFIFRLRGDEVELDLQLNNLIRDDVSVYVTENGVPKQIKLTTNNEEMYGYYQDPKTKASVMVACNIPGSTCQPVGTFELNGKKYRLEPTGELSEATHFVTEMGRDDGNSDMHGDLQNLPEFPLTGPKSRQDTEGKSRRRKRAIPAGVDILELFICADESIYQRFLALYGNMTAALAMIRQYYSIIGNEIDLDYQQVKSANTLGIDIRIYLKGVHVALDASGAPWSYQSVDSSGKLNSSKALNAFSTWQKNYRTANNLQYDHAMAMTAKKFQGTPVGITWDSAVCFPDSYYYASVIEDRGCRLALAATHEIGHFLSATHDPTTGSCSSGYIMIATLYTANATTATIQHTFSACSISSMTTFLTNLGSNRCTRQHSFTDAEYTAYRSQPIGGEVLSLNQQCQIYYGPASFACYTGTNMCYAGILCQTSTGCNGSLCHVLNHSPCPGVQNGWCFRGLCVQGPTPTSTTPIPAQSSTATTAPLTTTAAPTISTAAPTTTQTPTTTTAAPTTSTATPTTTQAPTTTTVALTTSTTTPTTTQAPTTTTVALTTSTTAPTTTTVAPTTPTTAPETTTAAATTSTSTTAPTTTTVASTTTQTPTTTTTAPSTSTAAPTTTTVAPTTTQTPTTTTAAPTTSTAAPTTTQATTTTSVATTTTQTPTTTTVASTTTQTPTTTTTAPSTSTAAPTTTQPPTTTTVAPTTTQTPTTTTVASTTTQIPTTTTAAPTTSTAAPTTTSVATTTTQTPTTTTVASTTTQTPTTTTTAPSTSTAAPTTTTVAPTTTQTPTTTTVASTTTQTPTITTAAPTTSTAAPTTTQVPTTTTMARSTPTAAPATTTSAPTTRTTVPVTTTAPATTSTAAKTTSMTTAQTTTVCTPRTVFCEKDKGNFVGSGCCPRDVVVDCCTPTTNEHNCTLVINC